MIKLNKVVVLIIGLSIASCDSQTESVKNEKQPIVKTVENNSNLTEVKRDSFSLKTTFSPEFGWGYQVLNWGALYINQPHVPAIQGNKGFESKEKAIKTAEYIIYKLENNMFPPTISPQELDSLGVL